MAKENGSGEKKAATWRKRGNGEKRESKNEHRQWRQSALHGRRVALSSSRIAPRRSRWISKIARQHQASRGVKPSSAINNGVMKAAKENGKAAVISK
jgi:hypothetical protein